MSNGAQNTQSFYPSDQTPIESNILVQRTAAPKFQSWTAFKNSFSGDPIKPVRIKEFSDDEFDVKPSAEYKDSRFRKQNFDGKIRKRSNKTPERAPIDENLAIEKGNPKVSGIRNLANNENQINSKGMRRRTEQLNLKRRSAKKPLDLRRINEKRPQTTKINPSNTAVRLDNLITTLNFQKKGSDSSSPKFSKDSKFNSYQKRLNQFKKPQLTEEEIKLTNDSNKLMKDIGKKLAESDGNDSFLEKLKHNKVTSEILKSNEDHSDLDLDADFNIGLRNNYEETDENQNYRKQRKIVELKYQGRKLPGSLNRMQLKEKAAKHLVSIPKILSGKIASPYYGSAVEVVKSSSSVFLSSTEFLRLPMEEFTVGFYGMKRQSYIASLIKESHISALRDAIKSNRTIKFWSIDSFVLYILACDIAMRIAAEDLGVSKGEAYDILYETGDYGKYITDSDPL